MLSNKDRSYNFILKVYRDPVFYYLTTLVAIPGLSFKNNLPFPIKINLKNHIKDNRVIELEREEMVSFSDYNICNEVSYKILVGDDFESQEHHLLKKRNLVYEKVLRVDNILDNTKELTYMNVIRLRDGFNHFNFSVYCDVIIINETKYLLDFYAQLGRKKKTRVKISSFQGKIALIGA